MITELALGAFEKALNQYIKLDPELPPKLAKLSGKVIAIRFQDIGLAFFMIPSGSSIQVMGHYVGAADVTLSGTPFALAKLSFTKGLDKTDSLFAGEVEITGDTELGHQFKNIFDSMEIDWEEHLSHFVGDAVAHQVGSVVRGAFDWGKASAGNMQDNVSEFLQEEAKLFPPREEVEDFFKDIDELRMAADRVEAHLQRLQNRG